MSAFDMTDEEVEQAMRYGFCEVCGGPRTSRVERTEEQVTMVMVCLRCGREAE